MNEEREGGSRICITHEARLSDAFYMIACGLLSQWRNVYIYSRVGPECGNGG